ncbi:helix-turn-helix domain-containing protein [Natrinema amylolyticum]|uniref:helix-turn-helix domain-containing protein n=1 Tax=Natrinema amylolyticum TaxID=2878679 RepID=UPI001CFA73EE|nr:helix-turn-helix domain-containing protein [Natrinema amylolyticum]
MIRAQFRIRLPEGIWVRELSQTFPDATFTLLTGYRTGDRAIELGEIRAENPDASVDALRSHPATTRFELLELADGRALGKYETTDTGLYDFVERSSLPVEFPVTARDGWFEFDLTGTRDELDRLQATLEASDAAYELQSLVSTTDADTLVTDRQRELLEIAIREGYYEVPRECTLAEVAETVGIDKGTASTILRRGEATLLKWLLSGPETNGRRGR